MPVLLIKDKIFDVNVKSHFFLVKSAVPHMPSGSSILFVSSYAGYMPNPLLGAYSVSKTVGPWCCNSQRVCFVVYWIAHPTPRHFRPFFLGPSGLDKSAVEGTCPPYSSELPGPWVRAPPVLFLCTCARCISLSLLSLSLCILYVYIFICIYVWVYIRSAFYCALFSYVDLLSPGQHYQDSVQLSAVEKRRGHK